MGHYAKLATMGLRFFGVMMAAYGALAVIASAIYWFLGVGRSEAAAGERGGFSPLAWLIYALVGVGFYALSRPLARLLARGLDERAP